ncbi:MAG: TonB-dependent receptor plug domain-containing protein [Terracidiphilus sp.]|nr:TonB-dependent receptor plug domain-containing protein [Terracidiphilus sp.]
MFPSSFASARRFRAWPVLLSAFLLLLAIPGSHAASIRGVVTDASGARITGAAVSVVSGGKVLSSAVSASDGSFQITTGTSGHMFLVISAKDFRQLETPDFYAGRFDTIERNLVLEPEWARESIVVAATGTPTPQSETSSATTVLDAVALDARLDLPSALRTVPGAAAVQSGQRGSATSLFVRGGGSGDNKVLIDGIDAGDLGNQIDFGPFSTSGVESVEIYRGPNSSLFGAGAMTGVLSLTTPHGTTPFPSILFASEGGNFNTSRQLLEVAGTKKKFDYLGSFNWFQTGNAMPRDQHHLATSVANIGWQPVASTVLRGTVHYGVASVGVPNAWDFYHVADNSTEKDQNLFIGAAAVNKATSSFQNTLRYGAARKREQVNLWSLSGNKLSYSPYCWGPGTYGNTVTITGANGYSATGQAALDCSTFGVQYVSNRDQLLYQGDVAFTPHLAATVGFHYEDERGSEPGSTYYTPVERSNYDYIAAVHGDYLNRFYYTLGGSLMHYSLVGTEASPRAGFAWYALRPRSGAFSGTRILFNYGDAVREPKLTDQDDSLYSFLTKYGGQSTIQQLGIKPLSAPRVRTYEAGFEQSFLTGHIVFRSTYFHNQFGREIEYVGLDLVPALLPGLTSAQQTALEQLLQANYAYELTLNSEAYRAQGVETSVESGIGRSLFFRGGWTWVDAVVQRSFTNSDQALLGPIPTSHGIPVGAYSPLVGARPFRRPPHTGYFTATWTSNKLTGLFSSSFASRSDDSTYLEGEGLNGGNSLLLPNRNLDHGYAKIDLGGAYHMQSWISLTMQMENLLSQQHIAPIGYVSLPMTFRSGIRINWGAGSGQ